MLAFLLSLPLAIVEVTSYGAVPDDASSYQQGCP